MKEPATIPRRAWLWVFAAYLFQAIPAAVRDEALPLALKDLGYTDGLITQIVAFLGLLVGCKILFSPFVAGFSPRRFILISELCIVALIGLLAFFLGLEEIATTPIIGCLIFLSLFSAAHDFALDGYFVSALDDKTRATHSGILNFASKTGLALCGAGLIWLVATIMDYGPQTSDAWSIALAAVAGLALLSLITCAVGLVAEPEKVTDNLTVKKRFLEMVSGFRTLLSDPRLLAVLILILFYRASEVHMAKVIGLFAEGTSNGGLALSHKTYGILRVVTATGGLAIGGAIGSFTVTKLGLSRSLVPLGILMHLPLIAFAWLAYDGTRNHWVIGSVFMIEYVAYGAGFCALILAMMKLASGPGAAVRYAVLSTFSLLANYLPGLWAGHLAERLGYAQYFLFALSLAIPGILSAWHAKRHFQEA
jgi:PAT family beta-lactamase induction signal transducer AmpG